MPNFCVRVEVRDTDSDDQLEFHVVIGGAQRGGLSVSHGYLPTSGPELGDQVEDIVRSVRKQLESYATTIGSYQLRFEDSQ
jgi:hypothetical protein